MRRALLRVHRELLSRRCPKPPTDFDLSVEGTTHVRFEYTKNVTLGDAHFDGTSTRTGPQAATEMVASTYCLAASNTACRPHHRRHDCPQSSRMNGDTVVNLVSQLLHQALMLCLPLLAVILVVGLLISVLQVVTQVQDPSVSFVPKLMVFGLVLALLTPWLLTRLTAFGVAMFQRLATIGTGLQ
jgi:flagellar biosynthesis protein FliQ